MVECLRTKWCVGLSPLTVTLTSDIMTVSSKEFLNIQETPEHLFTLKRLCDMKRTHSQMHHTDKYSQQSSIL